MARLLALFVSLPAVALSISYSPNEIQDVIDKIDNELMLHNDRTSHIQGTIDTFLDVLNDVDAAGSASADSEDVDTLVQKIEDSIHQINVKQINDFRKELDDILATETEKRMSGMGKPKKKSSGEFITEENLKKMFDEQAIFKEHDATIKAWAEKIVHEHINELAAKPVFVANDDDQDIGSCVSPGKAAQELQMALQRYSMDGTGLFDYAQHGRIVHELTSRTYRPPSQDHETMGHPNWRRFIPEDIEDILPKGWEKWSVKLPSFARSFFGLRPSVTSRPETILHGNTQPGFCWPMEGREGHFTIQLPHPMIVEAVSVDHVSEHLLMQGQTRDSAPKDVRLTGYRPCGIPNYQPCDKGCTGLGFSTKDGVQLKEFVYELDGLSTQTVFIDESGSDELGDRECAISSGSCATNLTPVSAIRVDIESNWGNEDYTCIYRFRVHGKPVEGTD